MALDVIAVVLVAALLHATWNAMIKGRQTHDPLIGAMVVAAGAAVVSMGVISTVGGPEPASYPYVVASGIIHVGYFLLVGFSYRLADFSAIYPLMRGSAPLITTAAAAWLLEERLGPAALFGIVLLSAGVLGLGSHALFRGGLDKRGMAVAAANVAVIVAYTVIDGVGTRLAANTGGYVSSMMLLTGVLLALIMAFWKPEDMAAGLRQHWLLGILGGAMVMASYGAALWAMTRAPIGAVAALRETSVLFGTVIAVLLMGEKFTAIRGLATLAIFAGLTCLRLV